MQDFLRPIRERVKRKEYQISAHAETEREAEEITIPEIVETVLTGEIWRLSARPTRSSWSDSRFHQYWSRYSFGLGNYTRWTRTVDYGVYTSIA